MTKIAGWMGIGCLAAGCLGVPLAGADKSDEEPIEELRGDIEPPEGEEAAMGMGASLVGEEAYPMLLQALRDEDPAVRAKAATALGLVPPGEAGPPEAVVEALQAAAKDEDPTVRARAQRSLDALEEPSVTGFVEEEE